MDFTAHFVEFASALFVAYVGYALGRSDLRIHPALTAVTVVVGVILHGIWQLALPRAQGTDWIAMTIARSPGALALVTVAVLETAGIWIPVLLVHWAAPRTRIWAAAYIMGAATVAAATNDAP